MRWKPTLLAATVLPWLTTPALAAAETPSRMTLAPIDVVDRAPVSTRPSAEQAADELRRIPGGTTLIDEARIRRGRAANLADVLDDAPGVFARSRFGADELRLSIRGSGISRTFNTRGIRLLRDGLPMTEADGNTRTQLIDPLSAEHISVYRGANALGWGASTLGGAINLTSPTGYSVAPRTLRAEAGSFGYARAQARGAWNGASDLDGVAALSLSREDGFRSQSAQQSLRFYGNTGIQHDERRQTRIHLDLQDSRLDLPGSLTRQEFRDDPRQADPAFRDVDAARDLTLARLAIQHGIRLRAEDQLQVGTFVQDLRMDHPLPFAEIDSSQQDIGLSLRHVVHGSLLGMDTRFTWGGLAVTGRERATQENRFTGAVTRRNNSAATVEVYADNSLAIGPATRLVTSLQLSWADREEDVRTANAPEGRRIYRGASPRIGLIHELMPGVQAFSNLSRSLEPPINGELISEDGELVRQQRADTAELGLRGDRPDLEWEVVVYRAWLRNEILLVEDPANPGDTLTGNADRSIHQGIELGGRWRQDLGALNRPDDALELGLSYTLNDFRFRRDPLWGGNRIPGLPRHVGQLEAIYRAGNGFHAGPVLAVSSRTPVDFANTETASAYALLGLRAGFDSGKGWRLFLDGRNLTDRRHAATTGIVARADASSRVYNPGSPRSVYGGVQWDW